MESDPVYAPLLRTAIIAGIRLAEAMHSDAMAILFDLFACIKALSEFLRRSSASNISNAIGSATF